MVHTIATNGYGRDVEERLGQLLERQQAAFQAQLDEHYCALVTALQHGAAPHQALFQTGRGSNGTALHGFCNAQSPFVVSSAKGAAVERDITIPPLATGHAVPMPDAPSPRAECLFLIQPGQEEQMSKERTGVENISGLQDATSDPSSPKPQMSPTSFRSSSTASFQTASRSKIRTLMGTQAGPDPNSLRGMVARFVSKLGGACIFLNTLVMFVQLLWYGDKANKSLGLSEEVLPPADHIFYALELFFCSVFLIELLVQLGVFGLNFFRVTANILDMAIVIITSVEVFILTPLAANVGNVSFVRMLRLTKFLRALKVVRTVKSCEGLRVILATVIHSFAALVWAMLVLLIFQLMFAIFLCQSLHGFVTDEVNDLHMRLWVNRFYGNGFKALQTVFEMTFSGCWPNYARPVIEDVNSYYAPFFVVYITFVVFAMIRVISALFLKETLQQASRDAEMMVRERSKKSTALQKELLDLFHEADSSGDNLLSRAELNAVTSHPKVSLWLQELGLQVSDIDELFDLIDNGDGDITAEEFVKGIMRLRGEARAQDLIPILKNCQRILLQVKDISVQVDRQVAFFDDQLRHRQVAHLGPVSSLSSATTAVV